MSVVMPHGGRQGQTDGSEHADRPAIGRRGCGDRWGVQPQRHGCDQERCRPGTMRRRWCAPLALMIVRQILRRVGLGPSPDAKDMEIAVLRHHAARRLTRGLGPARATGRPRAEQGPPLPAILHAPR